MKACTSKGGDEDVLPKFLHFVRKYVSVGVVWRHNDAEHPLVIPMDLPSSHQVPRGPMTRARARALETEVTSFLSDITYDPLETWLLPKSDMLCMIRCQEEPPEDAREDGQATKFMDEENRRKEKKTAPGPGHPAPAPDIRLLPKPRTSGPMPGHPAPPVCAQ